MNWLWRVNKEDWSEVVTDAHLACMLRKRREWRGEREREREREKAKEMEGEEKKGSKMIKKRKKRRIGIWSRRLFLNH